METALKRVKNFIIKCKNNDFYISRILLYFFLLSVSFVFLYPFLRMIVTSVMSYSDLNDPAVTWLPHGIYLKNYSVALSYLDIQIHGVNSLIITLLSTVGHILSCSFVAYGFSRFKFKLKNLFFAIVVFSIIIPPQVLILPQYIYYLKLNFLNTYLPIILPCFLGYGLRGGLYIYIFRQNFMGLPLEIEDAAAVDGYGPIRTYAFIVMPNARNTVLVAFLVSFVWHWNDYYEPSYYLTFQNKLPLPAMLNNVLNAKSDYYSAMLNGTLDRLVTDGVVMAAIFICTVPLLLLYFVLQNGFMQGLERSGLVE